MAYALEYGMTIHQTLTTIKQMGLSARYNSEYKEYRVTVKTTDHKRAEDIAYYTSDSQDAIDTAKKMIETI